MEQDNQVSLEFDVAENYVDLSKPFDYSTLHYTIVNKGNFSPVKENTLYLTIDKYWFNEIIEGRKDKEYREVRDSMVSRYLSLQQTKDTVQIRDDAPEGLDLDIMLYNNGYFPFCPRPYAFLKLAVGYSKDRAWAIIEVKAISFEPAMDDNGNIVRFTFDEQVSGDDIYTPDGEGTVWTIVYHLGKVMEYHPKGEQASLMLNAGS